VTSLAVRIAAAAAGAAAELQQLTGGHAG